MAKRRGDGEGSIYQAKDGRWRAEISLGYKPDGKKKRKVVYGRTRVEVSDELKRLLRDEQLGVNVKPQKQALAAFLASWLEGTVKPQRREQTVRSYEWLIRVHIVPSLGKLSLDKVTPQRIQEFLAERHRSGLSAGTVGHLRATLRSSLSHAQRWGLVHQNAAKLVVVPSGARYRPTVLDPEQAREFLKFAAVHPHGPLLTLAISLGLRKGELLALKWRDISFVDGSLRVEHTLVRSKGAGLKLSPPKSDASRRIITLPSVALKALDEQKQRQSASREWAGSKWRERDFVFTTSVGTPVPPEHVNRELRAVLQAAKLPQIRAHDLRHSAATLLLTQGVHPKLVQGMLGHSTFQLTMDTYSHVLPALRNEVATRMDDVFAPTPTNAPTKSTSERVQ